MFKYFLVLVIAGITLAVNLTKPPEESSDNDNLENTVTKPKEVVSKLKEEQVKQPIVAEKPEEDNFGVLVINDVEAELLEQQKADLLIQADLNKKREAQKQACAEFVNTEFDELELKNGKILKSVTVTEADALRVSFMHSSGVATVEYRDLPRSISRACKYDRKLAEIVKAEEVQRDNKRASYQKAAYAKQLQERKEREQAAESLARLQKKVEAKKSRPITTTESSIRPSGKVNVKVVRTSRGNKTILVKGASNVDAILYLNDWYWHRYRTHHVKAGDSFQYTWESVGSRYEVKLVAKQGKKLLDRESHNQKSGL